MTEVIRKIKVNLKVAQDRQKSYADQRRRDFTVEVGDLVFLRVHAIRGHTRFGKTRKLKSRYVGPYPVIAKVGVVAYRLELPPELGHIHDVFHVSMLRKYIADPSHVLRPQEIELTSDVRILDQPLQIAEQEDSFGQSRLEKPGSLGHDMGARAGDTRPLPTSFWYV
ncbi:PREDICTED: uncharacterized protein LOC109116984 [Tarenaya hassleriana]|uniref:uncharacterized protein LOC109116984 n=1 Tax=Tarenaya hassleriana TaxID=28532 RepID=UPI0008FD13B7|nr:PREDICTED: uncharacterized protein LOC109116984 [Tarenaya hassleriana]